MTISPRPAELVDLLEDPVRRDAFVDALLDVAIAAEWYQGRPQAVHDTLHALDALCPAWPLWVLHPDEPRT